MFKNEAAIVSAYTGFLIGEFAEFHEFANDVLVKELNEKSKEAFITLEVM